MKRLQRSTADRKVAGVCGGLAEILGVDPTIVRLAAVFLGVATGFAPAIFTYIVAWIIVPEHPADPGETPGS